VPGFDLCTGWGTPMGTNLINALTTPDYLGILPQNSYSVNALVGGPLPQTNWTITLTNSGAESLDWALGGSVPAWLTVSAGNGTLAGNGSTNISLQLVDGNALPCNSYFALLSVTNLALSRVQNVTLEVDISQSIVVNGGFETGDFTGWTLMGDTITNGQLCNAVATDAEIPGVVHSGYFGAFLGQSGYAATLSQTLVTTPGQLYLVSFWLDNLASGNVQTFSASWDGTNFVNLDNPPVFTWTNFQLVATASNTNTVLQFAAENDVSGFGLDDVSVAPVPPVVFGDYGVVTNGFYMDWQSLAGLNYHVQYNTNLAQGGWLDLGPVAAFTNVTTFVDTNGTGAGGQGFYRLVLVPQ